VRTDAGPEPSATPVPMELRRRFRRCGRWPAGRENGSRSRADARARSRGRGRRPRSCHCLAGSCLPAVDRASQVVCAVDRTADVEGTDRGAGCASTRSLPIRCRRDRGTSCSWSSAPTRASGGREAGLTGRELAVCGALDHLRPLLLGADPNRTEQLWQALSRGGFFPAQRVLSAAIAAVDSTLWDIKGKRLGCPSVTCSAARCATGSPATPTCRTRPSRWRTWSGRASRCGTRAGAMSAGPCPPWTAPSSRDPPPGRRSTRRRALGRRSGTTWS
jgi:Mandelate racemase / muconate lactonizing enzyme, N-terminal domain